MNTAIKDMNENYPLPEDSPGHEVRIIGKPADYEQLQAIEWILNVAFGQTEWSSQNQEIENVWEMAFDLPYNQGAGFTVIEFRQWDEATDGSLFPPDMDHGIWVEMPVVVTFGYADSMTNYFHTALFRNEDQQGEFAVGEY